MIDLIRWYVVVQAVGLAALPLTARAFRGLPDRGYAFARPVGLLAVSALLWFGGIFGFWANTGATVALLTIALGLAGWLGLPGPVRTIRALWRERRSHVYVVEAVFLVAFVGWAFCRAHFPEIQATEKPMDFAFLNGIIRSARFPPADPWLSGNSISYYYLGYLLVAAVTELSGVAPSVAFNLAISLLFALTVTGAFALGWALVDGLRRTRAVVAGETADVLRAWPSWLAGGVSAIFVALLGNWEGFLELLHAHGVGSPTFWQSLGIWNLGPSYVSATWFPTDQQDNWWWFRASRVILDYPFGGRLPNNYNTINEFPFFSFLLGDMHPHLIALPYAFVGLGFALSFLRSADKAWLGNLTANPRAIAFDFGFIAFLFGAMFLLNAWDILTYLFVLVCAFAARAYLFRPCFDRTWLRRTVIFGVATLVAGLLLYWPFYLTFQSQASGLLGIVALHSHLRYFLIFWGPFLFLSGSFVVAELVLGWSPLGPLLARDSGPAWTHRPLVWIGVAVVAAASYLGHAPALTLIVPILVGALALIVRYLGAHPTFGAESVATTQANSDEELAVGAAPARPTPVAGGTSPGELAIEHVFVLVMLFVAALLLFGTELFFIQDSFHDRMNTVFKLYFQAWEMLALVGAYAVFYLGAPAFAAPARRARNLAGSVGERLGSGAWLAIVAVFVLAAFVYVPAALEARSNGFTNPMTLDGLAYYAADQPDDYAAIQWLQKHAAGTPTVVEATGGSYSEFGNVAWMTGIPTILGWDFHEIQWHGASIVPVVNQRKQDIDTIYRSTDLQVVQGLLRKYQVTYVYVGPLERKVYGQSPAGLSKFGQFMNVAYQNGSVTIYQTRGGT